MNFFKPATTAYVGLSPENNTSRVIKHINDCIDYDNNIKEFYTALGNSDEVDYYLTNTTEEMSAPNIFSLFSSSSFPSIVKTHYQFSEEIATCGCLPEIQRYYYIIDNKLFLWSMNSKSFSDDVVEQIMEDEKVIIAVSTIEKGRDRYFTKAVDSLLAVATATYIRIYPIQDDFINPAVFYTAQIGFTPTCICSGDWDQLFIGASDGQLYSLQFKVAEGGMFSEEKILESIEISKLTACNLKRILISFFNSAAPIYKICYDQSTCLLATIDNAQKIRIYSYSNESLSLKYTYSPPSGKKFVSISPVHLSDSVHLRFVAFTSTGERYFFGTSETAFHKMEKIALRAERKPPSELSGETVIDAFQQCGYTAFICTNSLVGLQVIHIDSESIYELVGKTKINGNGICITGSHHNLSWLDAKTFHSPIVNQHFMEPVEFYILTSNGGSSVKFRPPCYFVRQEFLDAHFQYVEGTNEKMNRYIANDESCAMCLLLASLYPEESDHYIFISGEFNRLQTLEMKIPNETEKDPDDLDNYLLPNKLTPITHAFFIRIQRLIQFMWDCPVFYKAHDEFVKVSLQFSSTFPDILKRIIQVKELSEMYLKWVERNSETFDEHKQVQFQIEQDQITSLKLFIDELVETLKFIRILQKQKASLLTLGLNNCSSKTVNRLLNECFGPSEQNNTFLITALREYAIKLITSYQTMIDTQSKSTLNKYFKNDPDPYTLAIISPEDEPLKRCRLDKQKLTDFLSVADAVAEEPWIKMESGLHLLTTEISVECPSFLNSPEALIIRAQLDLQAAERQSDLEEKKELVHSAAKTFIENSSIDFDISRICCVFISLGFDVYAVKIAQSRANFVDDAQLGYYWYINGCNDEEFNSKKKFEEVNIIYEAAFDAAYSDEGLNAILDTKDDLFILLVYQHLLKTNEIEKLLHLDNPLVLEFLKENDPKLVWKYYIAHNMYKEAINNLIRYASDTTTASSGYPINPITFDQRIECLQLASNYARRENYHDLADEAKIRIECAKIQKEMFPKVVEEPLKDLSELFEEAERKFLWSYLLRLVSLMKIDNFFKRDLDLKTLWANFLLCGDGSNQVLTGKANENDVNQKLKKLFIEIGPDKDALNPDYLVPAFEDFANFRHFRPDWTVDTLTKLKIDGSDLYKAYAKLIEEAELPINRYNQLIFAALWLLAHSFRGDISLILDKVKNVLEDSQNPYYDEIKEFMALFE